MVVGFTGMALTGLLSLTDQIHPTRTDETLITFLVCMAILTVALVDYVRIDGD